MIKHRFNDLLEEKEQQVLITIFSHKVVNLDPKKSMFPCEKEIYL